MATPRINSKATGQAMNQKISIEAYFKRSHSDVEPITPYNPQRSTKRPREDYGPSFSSKTPAMAPAGALPFNPSHNFRKDKKCSPATLAARLGPELVAELEALLIPGTAEMPSFEERRKLQRKYGVDRRHIYDWFRGKGLRVKEDRMSSGGFSAGGSPVQLFPTQTMPPLILDCGTSSSSGDSSPIGTPPPELTGMDVFDFQALEYQETQTNKSVPEVHDLSGLGFFEASSDSAPLDFNSLTAPSAPYYGFNEIPLPNSVSGAEDALYCEDDTMGLCNLKPYSCQEQNVENYNSSLFLDQGPLCEEDRKAIYGFLSLVCGPQVGIQYSVGTYEAYMQEQRDIYFEALLGPRKVTCPYEDASSLVVSDLDRRGPQVSSQDSRDSWLDFGSPGAFFNVHPLANPEHIRSAPYPEVRLRSHYRPSVHRQAASLVGQNQIGSANTVPSTVNSSQVCINPQLYYKDQRSGADELYLSKKSYYRIGRMRTQSAGGGI